MQYISEYIKVSSSKKLLYRIVLEKVDNNKFYIQIEVSDCCYLSVQDFFEFSLLIFELEHIARTSNYDGRDTQ